MRHREEDVVALLETQSHAEGRAFQPEVDPLSVVGGQWLADEQAVAVFGAPRPCPDLPVPALAGCADQAVLLQRIDDLLEPEDIRLQGGHVGVDERLPFGPSIVQVADVQRGDVEWRGHRSTVSPADEPTGAATASPAGAIGTANENVEPRPSSDSTQIRP